MASSSWMHQIQITILANGNPHTILNCSWLKAWNTHKRSIASLKPTHNTPLFMAQSLKQLLMAQSLKPTHKLKCSCLKAWNLHTMLKWSWPKASIFDLVATSMPIPKRTRWGLQCYIQYNTISCHRHYTQASMLKHIDMKEGHKHTGMLSWGLGGRAGGAAAGRISEYITIPCGGTVK